MGRLNVYLPDDLDKAMRKAKLKPSTLLQNAVRRELQLKQRRKLKARQ